MIEKKAFIHNTEGNSKFCWRTVVHFKPDIVQHIRTNIDVSAFSLCTFFSLFRNNARSFHNIWQGIGPITICAKENLQHISSCLSYMEKSV